MAETIYTIPINEAFNKRRGCPLCSLRADLESSSLEYIMGAAMMEPDIRKETNRLGFCRKHFDKMQAMKNRLGLALILESHLSAVEELLDMPPGNGKKRFGGKFGGKKETPGPALEAVSDGCFICHRIEDFERKYLSNTVYLWKTDEAFRKKLSEQSFFCLWHAGNMLQLAGSELDAKRLAVFHATVIGLSRDYIQKLRGSLSGFTRSFDHRHAGKPLTDEERRAVERSIDFLSKC